MAETSKRTEQGGYKARVFEEFDKDTIGVYQDLLNGNSGLAALVKNWGRVNAGNDEILAKIYARASAIISYVNADIAHADTDNRTGFHADLIEISAKIEKEWKTPDTEEGRRWRLGIRKEIRNRTGKYLDYILGTNKKG